MKYTQLRSESSRLDLAGNKRKYLDSRKNGAADLRKKLQNFPRLSADTCELRLNERLVDLEPASDNTSPLIGII
jgi:hypothetical protein